MIKIRIRNADHEIDLQFPISENKLYAKLAEIHAIEGKDAPQSAFVTEVYWPEEFSILKDRYILVHGGAIAEYHNYMYRYDNQEEFAVWNRIYYNEPDIKGKIIIFGHTPTSEYQHSNPLEIWRSPSGGKIGIDCGCGFPHSLSQGRYPAYGRLACLRLDDMKVFYSEEEIETENSSEP